MSIDPESSGPRAIGRYEILRPLATGGMAEIFLGRIRGIEGFQKGVVIKRLRPELAANPQFVEMFLDEARLMATLHHSNIVQVFDVGSTGGAYFFSMELLRGEDLRGVVKKARAGAGLPLDHCLFILAGALEGLHHAHERRGPDGQPLHIVHRDVSPSNIFVTYDGGVKLLDFGIAKTTVQTTQTRAGTLKGKIRYMSPEQCLGRPVDRRSDVFSAAIVLWELTTGRKLFSGGTDFELMRRIVDEDAPAPTSLVPDYPPELSDIVLKGLRRDPAERYQTAEEMQADIELFAREHKMGMSSRALGRWMHEKFADKIAVWTEAEEKGEAFAEHILEVFDSRQSTEGVSHDSASRPRPSEVAPKSSRATGSHGSVPATTAPSATDHLTGAAHVVPASPSGGKKMVAAGAVVLALAGAGLGWALSSARTAPVTASTAAPAAPPPQASTPKITPVDSAPPAATASAAAPSQPPAEPPASASASASAKALATSDPAVSPGAAKKPASGPRAPATSADAATTPAATTPAKPAKWDPDSPVLPQ